MSLKQNRGQMQTNRFNDDRSKSYVLVQQ